MSQNLTIRSAKFEQAISRWAGNSVRGVDRAVTSQLRLFVRDVIRITPPNKDYALNKAAGERRIRKELNGLMRTSRGADVQEPATVHARYRRSRGRVTTTLRSETFDNRIRVRGLQAYIATVVAKVGLLASGWAAAAQGLGLAVPPWIARHGTRGGSYSNVEGFSGRRVKISNKIPYANAVQDLGRRVAHAADNRAMQMEKQTAQYIEQAAIRAGFRVAGTGLRRAA